MRDVIRVERHPGTADGTVDGEVRPTAPVDGAAIDPASLAAIGRVADEVLPSIVARLAVSGLGELEVRHADWRIRVRRSPGDEASPASGTPDGGPATEASAGTPASSTGTPARPGSSATSPAVGYFVPRADLVVGTRVTLGDVLGWVEVLGIRQDVVAPVDGLVGKLSVGPGEPVEYGQELVQLVPAGAKPERGAHDEADA